MLTVRDASGALDELHGAFGQREQGVILADADVFARVVFGAALANDDVAGEDELTAVALDAKAFAFESRPLRNCRQPFVCHVGFSLGPKSLRCEVRCSSDGDPDVLVVLAATHLEDLDLCRGGRGNHGGRDGGASHHGVPILTDSPSPTMKTWSMVICEPTSAGICSTLSFRRR